jgi:hypothetical protein
MTRTLRKGEVRDCPFYGGALAGTKRNVEDVRREYRFWHRMGSQVAEGKATYDAYEWDEMRQSMVYVGTVFGYGDRRTMRRMTKAEAAQMAKAHAARAARRRR